MSSQFNCEMLLLARQVRGVSQSALSKRTGLNQGHLSKLETGLREPSEDVLNRLADVLGFPESFFLQTDRAYGFPVSVHPMHRKKARVGQHQLNRLHAEINIRLMHLRRLLRAADFGGQFALPHFDVDEYGEDPEKIAELLRHTWLLPKGPLKNLTECLERAGCIVTWCDFHQADVDGITLMVPDMPPYIFLNRDRTADRMRFTLAHELGHIVMHRVPRPKMEEEANLFASALLMPASDIRNSFRTRITLTRLARLKPVWRVSMQSLLVRATKIESISPNQAQYLWKQINAQKMRLREPPELDFPHETPTVLPMIFKLHLEQLGYSIHDLAAMLHVQEGELRHFYNFLEGSRRGDHLSIVS